jgi:CubicO group peptidase (beta-lactamase class C family)
MPKSRGWFRSFGLAFAAVAGGWMAAGVAQAAQPDVARMDQIAQSCVTNHQFMGTVPVAQNGKILLDKGYGDADLEWQIPNAPEVKFRPGSMTRQFTAASILLLEQRGRLSTDDLVKKYMPDAPAAWDTITIYNVLTHTSGIPSLTSFPDQQPEGK